MHWLFWVTLPLPLLSLATLILALRQRDAEPAQRRRMLLVSGLATVLGVALAVLAAGR